jgi:CheY-like chemotaxis protein
MNHTQETIHILLADDDQDDIDFFSDALKKVNSGIKLSSVSDGSEALEYLRNAERIPDCIFLDLNMPRMNGLECLEKIRDNESLKDVAVIIYSTSNNSREINEAIEKGATLYIVKTFSFAQLTRKLNLIIENIKVLHSDKVLRDKFVM